MTLAKSYFFCGIGGSGMLPLACILRARGAEVAGSDRARDQHRSADKFAFLEDHGVRLFPQDGSGISSGEQVLVTSAAVEENIPDVQAARRIGAPHLTRPQLLAQLFNDADTGIAVAGTSGKSTATGMIGWILHATGRDPTVMNGAVMKNFVTPETPFASALVGTSGLFVSEVDESDGSIALYEPKIAVLNNISLDHKTMDELRSLFLDFISKAEMVVVNHDDEESRELGEHVLFERRVSFSLTDTGAGYCAFAIVEEPLAVSFEVRETASGDEVHVRLPVPGRHNVANALAAIATVRAVGVSLSEAAAALAGFRGLRRRFDVVGTRRGITVIDDFAHNPDKIAATLRTLHTFPGRVLVLFQPHGYGPLAKMKQELIDCFADNLAPEDVLLLCQPAYFGGTVERTVGSEDIVAGVIEAGRIAEYVAERADAGSRLAELAREGDRIVIMGARDDTLSVFAAEVLAKL